VEPEKAKAFEIPLSYYEQLKKGEDYITKSGTVIPNHEVTSPNAPPRTYAYCADTLYNESIVEKIKGIDLLYHETTYLKDQPQKAMDRYHSTTVQAANIAKLAEVKQLIIGHFSSKYEHLDVFLTETKEVFENTSLAIEGSCYKI
jgi:ribonuclease Z